MTSNITLSLVNIPYEEQTEEMCLAAVKADPNMIKYAYYHTEKVCMAAITLPWLIKELHNPSIHVIRTVLKCHPNASIFMRGMEVPFEVLEECLLAGANVKPLQSETNRL